MGWLKEKYTRTYFLGRDAQGTRLPFGVWGVEYWEKGKLYPGAKRLLDGLRLKGATVLDLGFGRGEAIKYCIQRGAKRVVGIDFAPPALEIARTTLQGLPPSAYELICDDALLTVQKLAPVPHFTHILMLDVIEHIPRFEVEMLLPELYQRLVPGGCLVIHTPFYPQDENALATGGPVATHDDTDDFEETQGMHINRYTIQSLRAQMERFGFITLNICIFLKRAPHAPQWVYRGLGKRKVARLFGYKVQ